MVIFMDASIAAGEFKAKCLKLLDQVANSRQELIITKHGKPVAKLVPVPGETDLFGALAGSVRAEQDIVAPIGGEWEAGR